MAVIKLVVALFALTSPALSRPALGTYNYNSGAYNYNPGAYNPAYNTFNSGYAPGDTFDPHPRYSYDYRVAEPRTGDYKSAQESRDGDAVRGSYSVAEPDGSLLTVRYAADDAHGYTAVVERSGYGGTVVNTFPGPAPLPVAPIYSAGAAAPVQAVYVPPIRPVAPIVTPVPTPTAVHHPVFSGGYAGSYAGSGTTSTSFSGPHASYHY